MHASSTIRSGRVAILVAALVPLLAAGAAGQDRPAAPANSHTVAASPTGLAKVRMTALNRRRHLLLNLTQSDFHVFEGQQEWPIEFFSSRDEEPLNLGILIDDSRNTLDEPDPPDWRLLADFVHDALGPGDQAFVASFDESLHFETAWTEDTRALANALQASLAKTADRASALYDAIYTACDERFSGAPGRRVLVVISNSPDDYSARPELDVLNLAQRLGVAIYPVLPWVRAQGEPIFRNSPFAELFADQTGGIYFTVVRSRDLRASLAGIAALTRHYYVVGFRPGPSRDNRVHSIKITCARRGVRLHYRRGYVSPGG